MTWEIAAVLSILAVALVLFVTEKLRMDVVALLVLGTLGITRLVEPSEALEGFSNPAVVTVWAMFILSAGLSATGVADMIGRQVLKIAGQTEPRIIITIMLATGILSAFMNNIGVAALMLPVVMDIARKTRTSPSRLLMPMAYASLLGGLTTLIGTPPNLVASNALNEAGYGTFKLFEFAPIGAPALITGTLFIAFFGRKLLPGKLPEGFIDEKEGSIGFQYAHRVEKKHFQLSISENSPFIGKTLAQSRLGPVLGVHVNVIIRKGNEIAVTGDTVLEENDRLIVQGKVENFEIFKKWQAFEMASGVEIAELLAFKKLVLISAEIKDGGQFDGLTVKESDFRRRFSAHILSIRDGDEIIRGNLAEHRFKAGNRIQIETRKDSLPLIEDCESFENIELIAEESISDIYPDSDALLEMAIPEESHITGSKLKDTGLSEDLGLRILGIARKSGSILFPSGNERILEGDKLLIHGSRESIELIKGLQALEFDDPGDLIVPVSPADHTMCEATLAPQSTLAGKTLKEINFRNRYGVQVESIWRQGKSYRSHLRNMSLEFGDAVLISGAVEKIEGFAAEGDFLILTRGKTKAVDPPSVVQAWISGLIMFLVILIVLLGWVPIAVAAVAGSAVMIATKCLSIDAAYRAIEWKSVFLIACMIPLGVAMNDSGAAKWLAQGVATVASPFGPWGMVIGLYVMTALATTIVPTAALVVIMASIGIDASASFGIPPEMIVMAIAMAASASFTSPISHPANVLVMGPGGYRFIDYIKMGILLAIVVMFTVLPMIWLRWRGELGG
ncbi:MAG: SLC13 family permease [Verrucomicrobiales bacterium]|nr:SLC13 family permease [Verrucomicrobiales bacterium]